MARVLVFGARGYLGEHVVAALVAGGHDVIASVRPGSPHAFGTDVEVREGDLQEAAHPRQAIRDVDAVVFSAGRTFVPGMPMDEYRRQNVALTRNFLAALDAKPDVRVVFTSSMSAVAASREPHAFDGTEGRERADAKRMSPYDHAKTDCERLALAEAERGRNLVVLNPGYMLGPLRTPASNPSTTFLVEWSCLRKSPFCVQGGQSYCDVRDVAAAHVAALDRGQPGERYVVAGENLTTTDFHEELASVTGIARPRRIRARSAWVGAAVGDGVQNFTRGRFENPVHRDFVKSLPLFYYGDSSRARSELGYETRPLRETLIDTVRSLHEHGRLPDETFRYARVLEPDNVERVLLLRQLALGSPYREFLLRRFDEVFAACETNDDARRALHQVLAASRFDRRRGRFDVPRDCRESVTVVKRLFEYAWFGSNEFLSRVRA